MGYGFLFDSTLCIGCEECMNACHEIQGQPDTEIYELSDKNFTVVKNIPAAEDDVYFRQMCMHCFTPSCASVCPVGAFEKTKEGPVIYDADKCMGCRYCMVACPFDVPKYEWDKALPLVKKCDMCYSRIKEGGLPGCAEICPTQATLFGEREELIKIAQQRIADEPEKYQPHIYGLKEAGGTSVLFLSSVPLDKLGLKTHKYHQDFPQYTWRVMKEIPNVVTLGGVFLYGLYWVINRRMEVERIETEEAEKNIGGNHNENN